jgi:hypothetical protein
MGCWDCVRVGTDLSKEERPTYSRANVVDIAEGEWEGKTSAGPMGESLRLHVTVEFLDEPASYSAARPYNDGQACDIPARAVEQCKAMAVPARIEIVTDPPVYSATLSEIEVYGGTLTATGIPDADSYRGFPCLRWDVEDGHNEYDLVVLFTKSKRLLYALTDHPFLDIGKRL